MFTKNYSSKTKQMARNRLTIILLTRWQKNELPFMECAIIITKSDHEFPLLDLSVFFFLKLFITFLSLSIKTHLKYILFLPINLDRILILLLQRTSDENTSKKLFLLIYNICLSLWRWFCSDWTSTQGKIRVVKPMERRYPWYIRRV